MKSVGFLLFALFPQVSAYTPCDLQTEFDTVMCKSFTCTDCPLDDVFCVAKCVSYQKKYPKCRCVNWPCSRRCYIDAACPNDADLVECVDPTTPPPPEEKKKEEEKVEEKKEEKKEEVNNDQGPADEDFKELPIKEQMIIEDEQDEFENEAEWEEEMEEEEDECHVDCEHDEECIEEECDQGPWKDPWAGENEWDNMGEGGLKFRAKRLAVRKTKLAARKLMRINHQRKRHFRKNKATLRKTKSFGQ